MPAVSVSMFNANIFAVNVVVNNGPAISIPGTSVNLRYYPRVPGTVPAFVAGPPTPGCIGIGDNQITITPSGWSTPQLFPFNISGQLPLTALQIYIFWNQDTGGCQALFAANGQVFYQTQGQAGSGGPQGAAF